MEEQKEEELPLRDEEYECEEDQMRPVFEMSISQAQPRYIDTDEDDHEQFADLPRQGDEEDEDENEEEFEREDDHEDQEQEEEEDGFNTYAQELRERLDQEDNTDNIQDSSE